MNERTVAFLDILGFRNMVESQSAAELGARFSQIFGRTLAGMNRKWEFAEEPVTFFPEMAEGQPMCISYTFSDSIILISHDESKTSALAVLVYGLRVTQTLMAMRMPVRGAITYGDMYVDRSNSLFLGKALTRAYELEQRQNWIGVAIDDSVPAAFPGLLDSDASFPGLRKALFPRYEVPMKTGPVVQLHTLNWRWNLVVKAGTKSLFDDKGDWSARVKVKAALGYALEMRRQGWDYPKTQEEIPVEVRSFFVAAGPPAQVPPNHGDEY